MKIRMYQSPKVKCTQKDIKFTTECDVSNDVTVRDACRQASRMLNVLVDTDNKNGKTDTNYHAVVECTEQGVFFESHTFRGKVTDWYKGKFEVHDLKLYSYKEDFHNGQLVRKAYLNKDMSAFTKVKDMRIKSQTSQGIIYYPTLYTVLCGLNLKGNEFVIDETEHNLYINPPKWVDPAHLRSDKLGDLSYNSTSQGTKGVDPFYTVELKTKFFADKRFTVSVNGDVKFITPAGKVDPIDALIYDGEDDIIIHHI